MTTGVVFALVAAIAWGVADFVGGLLARRESTVAVTLWSQLSSGVLLALVIAACVLLDVGSAPQLQDLGWAAAAGVSGGLGIMVFYAALAAGAMSLVAPISACGVALPVLVALVIGEFPGMLAMVGVAVALIGLVIVSRVSEPGAGDAQRPAGLPVRALGLSLLAALGFGGFFVLVDHAAGSGLAGALWVAAGARVGSVGALSLLAVAARRSVRIRPSHLPAVAFVGVTDVSANVAIAGAAAAGNLAVVSIVGSLYPAVTIALAAVVLHERLTRLQQVGVGLLLVALVLLTS